MKTKRWQFRLREERKTSLAVRKQNVRIIYSCLLLKKWIECTKYQNYVFFFSTFDMDKLAKIRHHHCKKRLKISKIAQFESNLLKPNEDIGPRRRKILHTFYDGGEHTTESQRCEATSFLTPRLRADNGARENA